MNDFIKPVSYSKTKCHEFDEEAEISLFSLFKKLNYQFGATYLSYTFDVNDKKRYSFRTDSIWAEIYHKEEIQNRPIIEQCPLDIVSRSKENKIILWDAFSHKAQPKVFKDIMGLRNDLDFRHGITLSTYFGNHHDAIALATEDKKNDLALRLMNDEGRKLLCQFLLTCRKKIIENLEG